MRVIVTGDRNWHAPELAEEVLNRLFARYGPNLVIVHGGATEIYRSFAEACSDMDIEQEAHPARWEGLDDLEGVIRYDKR
jgi:acetylglutamate kinase